MNETKSHGVIAAIPTPLAKAGAPDRQCLVAFAMHLLAEAALGS